MADGRYGDGNRSGYGRRDSIFSDDDRNDRRNESERGSDRGFFQRAGEEVKSWFSDDDERSGPRGQGSRQEAQRGGYGGEGSFGGYGGSSGGHNRYGGGGVQSVGQANRAASSRAPWGGGSSTFDDHYLSWRERQIQQLDRDYDEYCRDRQQQFESDFHSWRQRRQGQGAGQGGSSGDATPDQGGVTSRSTGTEAQSAARDSTSPAGDRGSGSLSEASAASTAGGGGVGSATESSTGSSATTGSGSRPSRKSQDRK